MEWEGYILSSDDWYFEMCINVTSSFAKYLMIEYTERIIVASKHKTKVVYWIAFHISSFILMSHFNVVKSIVNVFALLSISY